MGDSKIVPYSKRDLTRLDVAKIVDEFSKVNGASQVWSAWRSHMMRQGRVVKPEYTSWETLPDRDKELDAHIAFEVIMDFWNWFTTHPHEQSADAGKGGEG